MKLVWKLSIPQLCIVVCLGVVSFAMIKSSFINMREQYVREAVNARFYRITKNIEASEREAVRQAALFVRLPVVIRAYEMALGGKIDDAYSPQSQAARELLRKELAPMLNSYSDQFGNKLQLHFHLPNAHSLVRLWRDKQTVIKGESIDVSDDLAAYRPTVVEVNKTGKTAMGIELGSGGFAIRGVIPVKAPDGRQLGSAEVLQDFQPILDRVREEGKVELILYVNKDRITIASDVRNPAAIATDLQDPRKNPRKGNFVRVTTPRDGAVDSLISPALLSWGTNGTVFEQYGATALATLPIDDFQGTQLGVLVCAMDTEDVTKFADTAEFVLTLMLVGMAIIPSMMLLQGVHILVTGPLSMIRAKIQDITEDRADLSAQIPSRQEDEIGELARWFNALMTKLIEQLRTIERLSMTDQLTAAANRRSFDERLNMEWSRAIRNNAPMSILLMDADRFKHYNDTYGHLQGDVALQTIARTLEQKLVRPADFFARWGGEEFAILLPHTNIKGGLHLGEQIRLAIENTVIPCADGAATRITVSIGVNTRIPTHDASIDDFLSGADKALYAAKNTGRNRICLYAGADASP
ncbi:MAG: diguanylate cyclase [Deltaproteobacteria bacterium]|nr:diguanylate cyclase [Deltaproteobacteria bacterium]